jgi:hypothetical protein
LLNTENSKYVLQIATAIIIVFITASIPWAIQIYDNKITEYRFLEILNTKFAVAHNYSESYDCENYSRDYYILMKNLGYDASVTIGCNSEMCHAWNKLSINIESQKGTIVTNYTEEYPKSYK